MVGVHGVGNMPRETGRVGRSMMMRSMRNRRLKRKVIGVRRKGRGQASSQQIGGLGRIGKGTGRKVAGSGIVRHQGSRMGGSIRVGGRGCGGAQLGIRHGIVCLIEGIVEAFHGPQQTNLELAASRPIESRGGRRPMRKTHRDGLLM